MILPYFADMGAKLQIYILCRDRPDYAVQAIESVIKSSTPSTQVIVSDNSESDLIQNICHVKFPSIRYIRRPSPRTSAGHFKAILNEATSEYLVLFHDDDIMSANYVATLLPYIEANTLLSAVGCNAEIIDENGKATGKFFLNNLNEPLTLSNSSQFMAPYLLGNIRSKGAAPFPSYIYRRKHLKKSFVNHEHGGKYSDVSFLLKILHKSDMVWHPEPLMFYRIHKSNDSAVESITDRLSLIRYLIKHEGFDRKSLEIRCFKFTYWTIWWRNKHKIINFFIPNGSREKIIFRFLAFTCIKLLFSDSAFRRSLLWKVANLIKQRMR
jgi:hypothetical protein